MEITVKKEDIVSALNTTLGVVEKRQTLPILANVLIEVDENTFKLTATDLESEVTTSGPLSSVESAGKTTTSAKKLNELCRLIPDGEDIKLSLNSEKLNIKTLNGKYSLSTLPSSDFPIFDIDSGDSPLVIPAKDLRELIRNTSFAMGNQDWRHYLNGLFLLIDDKSITSVATDAHRLALATSSLNEATQEGMNGIVPRKSINEIGKLVGEESENVIIELGRTSIAVKISGTTFISKLIEGKFPDYEQVIPSGDSSQLVINRKTFSECLSRVSVLSSEKYKGVRILTSENSMNVSANNPEKEQGEENISCNYKGEQIDIAFNVNYLQEILSTLDSENIEINFFGSDKSCLITDPNSADLKYVVMPLLI